MANARLLLILGALTEAGTGLLLLFVPDVILVSLLGLQHVELETLLVGRVAGAALMAIGIACWLARNDQRSPAQLGLLVGLLAYNLGATVLLTWAGTFLLFAGILLWPAVGFHAAMAVWGCLVLKRPSMVPSPLDPKAR